MPLAYFCKEMFGSGRKSHRDDLGAVKQLADLKYVRFHAMLHVAGTELDISKNTSLTKGMPALRTPLSSLYVR